MTNVTILDNKGKTADRYTIIDRKTGDVWGCSTDPFHPQGIGTYSHNIADAYWRVAYGYNWRNRINVNRAIKDACTAYLNDCASIGVRVKNKEGLPEQVKKYIKQITE